MSLSKTITNSNGVAATYHRIAAVSKNQNIIVLEVLSYTSVAYRNNEIDLIRMHGEEDRNINRIAVLTGKNPLTVAESEELNALMAWKEEYYNLSAVGSFYAFSNSIEIEWGSEDLSFANLYGKLKETALFAGAEDC